jgi:cellobiose phosphorylase/cellobionic acid phosphorylase
MTSTRTARLISKEAGLYRFATDRTALHILTPETPAAWSNYFFNDLYYLEIDQCGHCKTRIDDNGLRTPRGNYRYFYLRDEMDDLTWNLTSRPLNVPLDSYQAVHTPTHSEFHSSNSGIVANASVLVPTKGCRELWQISLRNESDRPRQLSLYSVFPFEDEALMKARSWYEAADGICYGDYFPHHHAYKDYERLKDKRTLNYLFSTQRPIAGESSERQFFGSDDRSHKPRAVSENRWSGTSNVMDLPIGALHHKVSLEAGESIKIGFCYGIEHDEATVKNLQNDFSSDSFERALATVTAGFTERSNGLKIETPDIVLNEFVNDWLPKQIAFQSRRNRLSGAFPIRNQLQDCMGYSLLDPQGAADYLRTRIALQSKNGSLRQWWAEGDTDQHSLCALDFKDAGIWLILCTTIIAYQNGSLELMYEQLPFNDSDENASVFEHMIRAATYLAKNRGEHGLCLFGDGDWTDPINGAGRKGKGESTWTTCALGVAVQLLQEVAEALDDLPAVTWLRELDESLHQAVHLHCWDGTQFVTGYDDEGQAFGTSQDAEGKIFLNSQTWALIAGYVSPERHDATLATIHSMETPAGSLVSWPPFTQWNPTWGRISVKQAGTTENGSVYCHASMFKAYAECRLGQGDAALREILRLLPSNPENPPSHNTQAPIFLANYYFGLRDKPEFGISSRNHHTGTAPWMLWIIVEHILGVRATPVGLKIAPNLPKTWTKTKLQRTFRNSTYDITLRHRDANAEVTIIINGIPHTSTTLPCGLPHYEVSIWA